MYNLQMPFPLAGHQPQVINELTNGINKGYKYQVLEGVTGSGKTCMMANIINNTNKTTLILAHNKTLVNQLYNEFKTLFPNNHVEMFMSHFSYFQPECYLPTLDKYIDKTSAINEEIEKQRMQTIYSLIEHKDVIVISTVSAIFGLGNPEEFKVSKDTFYINQNITRNDIILKLIRKRYERINGNKLTKSGTFRVLGDVIDIYILNDIIRIELFGDNIELIKQLNPKDNLLVKHMNEINIYSMSSWFINDGRINSLCNNIQNELEEVYNDFKNNNQILYAERIKEKTTNDIMMIKELGWCKGLEMYQRYLSDNPIGTPPYTLLDYFPDDYLLFIDESHTTIPQVKSISNQNVSIKQNLIQYGFRLPSCIDSRPLNFKEFEQFHNQVIFVSATPAQYEKDKSEQICKQFIRPTGLLDPIIDIRTTKNQIDDIYSEIQNTIDNDGCVLITVISQKMAEDLSDYLIKMDIKACYLHAGLSNEERLDVLNNLKLGKYDVLVGCNLLREGLSIPKCQLVIILDADKEGFLRNETSLMQTIGRCARNINGHAILYADKITKSIARVVELTNDRRIIQIQYNKDNNIIPTTTREISVNENNIKNNFELLSKKEKNKLIDEYTILMKLASSTQQYEDAILYRDKIKQLQNR